MLLDAGEALFGTGEQHMRNLQVVPRQLLED